MDKAVFRALRAVVWVDGVVAPAESAALLATARAVGLSEADVQEIATSLETPVTIEDVGPLSLDPDQAEFAFSVACILCASDEVVDPREHVALRALGERLGLSAEARARAAAASATVAMTLGIQGPAETRALDGIAKSFAGRDAEARAELLSAPQTPYKLSNGTCDLPILYRQGDQFGVFFRADLTRARRMFEGTNLEPWPVLGAAIVAIYAWDYQDSTVGKYGEVGLGIQCRRRGTSPSLLRLATDMGAQNDQGIWVVNLPVTSPAACLAGMEIWGYPKYVTEIRTKFDDAGASVQLGDELELSVGKLGGPRLAAQPVVTYTERNGRILRTRIDVANRVRWGRGGARLTMKGDGPTAARVRELGIDAREPLVAFRAEGFCAKLPAGEDLGPIRS
jgi:tellurite resistance protein